MYATTVYQTPEAVAHFDQAVNTALADILAAHAAKHTTRNRKPDTKPKRQRFTHRYIRTNKLSRRVGIELTFMPGGMQKEDARSMRDIAANLSSVFKRRAIAGKLKTNNIGMDPDVVEVSTKRMHTRRSLTRTIGAVWDIAESLYMVGRYDWHGGGGAHVHVDFTKDSTKGKYEWDAFDMSKSQALKVLLLDATSRPYINYAFANPGDTDNTYHTACALYEDEEGCTPEARMSRAVERYNDAIESAYDWRREARDQLKRIRHYRNRWPTIADRKGERENGCTYGDEYRYAMMRIRDRTQEAKGYRADYDAAKAEYDAAQANPKGKPARNRDEDFKALLGRMGKQYGITPRKSYGTVEFRIFQAPESREEHELHVDFALAYIEWCEWQAKTGAIPQATYRTKAELLAEWPLERCKSEFIKFCKTIGLKASQYKRYIANIEHRFALGENYL